MICLFFFLASFVLIIFFVVFFFIVFIMINTRSFHLIFIEFRRRFKVQNSKTKRFLNKIVFLNFICAITSVKFSADSTTKTTILNLNNLKMIDVLNSVISASSALVQMSGTVVENSNSPKHSPLIHLSEPVKIKWRIMISFIINFDNLIVFYSSFRFFFVLFWPFSRVDFLASHHTSAGRADGGGEWRKNRRCVFFFELKRF